MNYIELLDKQPDLVTPGTSACQGCPAELSLRSTLKVLGENTIMCIPPGCMAGAGCVGWNFDSGLKVPVHITLLDNTAAVLTGIKKSYEADGRDVTVASFAGDGATSDCGFQSLSAAAERGENVIYICYDNEGYMNTGFQRSGSTTKGSMTTTTPVGEVGKGKEQQKKDLPLIMAMHNPAYLATLSPSHMSDFVKKVEKAKSIKDGFVYLHIFSPCPTGWGFDGAKSIEVARKAVETNLFPLYEIDHGEYKFTVQNKNPKPVSELFGMMKKFRHVSEQGIQEVQNYVDKKYKILQSLVG
ncbi:MAG: NADH-dependent phenylglyoxylate [Eubacteriaceae bacterium]|nr:NADH-dependent phenylglyoxylate [Eubacteriaceae bacterium]